MTNITYIIQEIGAAQSASSLYASSLSGSIIPALGLFGVALPQNATDIITTYLAHNEDKIRFVTNLTNSYMEVVKTLNDDLNHISNELIEVKTNNMNLQNQLDSLSHNKDVDKKTVEKIKADLEKLSEVQLGDMKETISNMISELTNLNLMSNGDDTLYNAGDYYSNSTVYYDN